MRFVFSFDAPTFWRMRGGGDARAGLSLEPADVTTENQRGAARAMHACSKTGCCSKTRLCFPNPNRGRASDTSDARRRGDLSFLFRSPRVAVKVRSSG